MIEEQLRIHDRFSLELKVGFQAMDQEQNHDFQLNLWMFVPHSLDINRFTYEKTNFYRDLKSNIRQITPVWSFHEICKGPGSPYDMLGKSILRVEERPDETMIRDFEFHVKMFQSIFKSSLREQVNRAMLATNSEIILEDICATVSDCVYRYRQLADRLEKPYLHKSLIEFYRFGDEFMSNMVEYQLFRLLHHLTNAPAEGVVSAQKRISELIQSERSYRLQHDYLCVERGSDNHDFVNRLSMLKKYIESHLYLNVNKRKDGVLVEQVLFSLAAGLSMVFATAVAFSFQQRFGSFTMPLFVALVVSYMLKDRIKEMTRYYFAHKMGKYFYDHKAVISMNDQWLGWAKESMDFIDETTVPMPVMQVRNRTTLIEAHNRANSEKVLLYRLRMHFDRKVLNRNRVFRTHGLYSIIRFNFSEFLRNMDDPNYELFYPSGEAGYEIIEGEKLYYFNCVVEKIENGLVELLRYRISINRDGIKKIRKY